MPSLTTSSNRNIEAQKRKAHTLTRKKDTTKLTEEEFQTLLGITERKINILKIVCDNILPVLFGKSEKDQIIAGIKICSSSNIEYKRLKQTIKIEEMRFTFSWEQDDFFGRNLEKLNIINKTSPINLINPIKYILDFEENFIGLIEQGYKEINKKNINNFIKDVDILLGMYYLNPSLISPTTLSCNKIVDFVNARERHYFPRWYKPKFEKLNYDNTHNQAGISGEIILGLGNNNEHTYKINYNLFMNLSKETQFSWKVSKWSNSSGWILMLNDDRPFIIFNFNEIYSKNKFGIIEHDKIIKHCLYMIEVFDNHSIGGFDGDM